MWSVRSRGPAHVVAHRCLELQRAARPRGFAARLFGLDPLHPDAVAAYRGALRELRVGGILAQLGPGWRVLHALPQDEPGREIDHLVIGPAGVFTVTSAPAAATAEARAASRLLTRASGSPVVAQPIVAVLDARGGAVPSSETVVVGAHRLVRHLRSLPTRLAPDLVATVARAAEELTTWRPFDAAVMQHTDPAGAFAALRDEVDRARERRTIWRIALVAAVALTVFGEASLLFS